MKFVIILIIIVGLALGARLVNQYWLKYNPPPSVPAAADTSAPSEVPDEQLPGLPDSLQSALDEARTHGAEGLRSFLAAHGNAIADPRRASIELDYVVLITPSNPAEAIRIFARVKERLQPDSPVYPRIKKLQKTYE